MISTNRPIYYIFLFREGINQKGFLVFLGLLYRTKLKDISYSRIQVTSIAAVNGHNI